MNETLVHGCSAVSRLMLYLITRTTLVYNWITVPKVTIIIHWKHEANGTSFTILLGYHLFIDLIENDTRNINLFKEISFMMQ